MLRAPAPPTATHRVLLLVAACVLLFVLPVRASAATAPDPVLKAITTALAAKRITPVEAREHRATWLASARAARTARTSTRRANVAAVRTYTANLARSGGLTADRLAPALLSVEATTWVMLRSASFPGHESELEIPGEVVVFTYYSGRGVQFQPFETLKQGMRELNQLTPDITAARAIADRLMELDTPRGDSTTWEYFFPFGGPSRPWTSSISQALATEFFNRVGTSVPAAEGAPYEGVAAAVTRSFLRSPSAGGVAVDQSGGKFYLIYPFAPAQRILNGHLQVLLNLNRYAVASGSTQAQAVVNAGVAGVLPILPNFDTGGWSNYQPGQEAELSYHEFQTEQLVKLGEETGNATLAEYGARFTQYLEEPPVITIPATSWPIILPAVDGFRDAAVVRYVTNKRAKVTMVLYGTDDREVRRLSTTGGRGAGVLTWDGRGNDGKVVPDGDYRASITATDVVGNRSVGELVAPLSVERDVLPPELGLVTVRADGSRASLVTAAATDLGSGWIDAEVRIGSTRVATKRGPRAGTVTIRVPRPVAQVRAGTLVLRDSSGNATTQPLATS